MNKIFQKLSSKYRDLKKIFNQIKTKSLSSHRSYNHKIELTNDINQLSRSRIYLISNIKLQKLKEYLDKNLQKDFISSNYILYVSSMLFVAKSNEGFRVCINYRKLNIITRRNRYLISLIEKTLVRVIKCKYLTKLNVIAIFNKLRIYLNNKKYIIFVTFMRVYKYHVLSFNLINEFFNYQYYINDILWEFLNNFCSVYLNNILIYSKIKKQYVQHVKIVLKKLINVDLQININKCEFYIQKITFLEVFFINWRYSHKL